MRRDEFYKLVPKARFFTVTFIKRTTGEERVMLARLGVTAHLAGGELPYDAIKKRLVTVWDVQKKAYRNIPLENILSIKTKGVTYTFQAKEKAIGQEGRTRDPSHSP